MRLSLLRIADYLNKEYLISNWGDQYCEATIYY